MLLDESVAVAVPDDEPLIRLLTFSVLLLSELAVGVDLL